MRFVRYLYLSQAFREFNVKSETLTKLFGTEISSPLERNGLRVQINLLLFNTVEHSHKLPVQIRAF
jgi:hypothetical protein